MTSTPSSIEPSAATLSAIVASSSKTLAPSLPEMTALLTQWNALARQEKMDNDWTRALSMAMAILPDVKTVPELVNRLQRLGY